MDKNTFRNLVIPLTSKEQLYLKHPERRAELYKDLLLRSEIPRFFLDEKLVETCPPGAFFDHQKLSSSVLKLPIYFNKQTRFSVVPMYIRSFFELKYVYSGKCTAILNSEEVELSKVDFLLLDLNSAHRILPTGENDLVFNFSMAPPYFEKIFIRKLSGSGIIENFLLNTVNISTKHDDYIIFHSRKNDKLKELVEDILCEYLDPGAYAEIAIESYMSLLFIELIRNYQVYKEKEYRSQKKNYITEVIQYIQKHCDSCTLEQVAAHFNYNPDYLSRKLKNSTTQSCQSLRTAARMEQAAALLLSTQEPVYRIAEQVGYQNLNSFYKKFEATYHAKPSDYRNRQLSS